MLRSFPIIVEKSYSVFIHPYDELILLCLCLIVKKVCDKQTKCAKWDYSIIFFFNYC